MKAEKRQISDVLVIEDNAAFVAALRVFLGARIFAVSTLEEGLRAMASRAWNHVILDLDLPDSRLEQTTHLIPFIQRASKRALFIIMTGFHVRPEDIGDDPPMILQKGDSEFADKLLAAVGAHDRETAV